MRPSPPRVMIFPITMACNSKCRSCGIWRLPSRAKVHATDEVIAKVVRDPFLRHHVASLNVSGGEPFLHPGLTSFLLQVMEGYERLSEICINSDGHLLDTIEGTLDQALPAAAAKGIKLRLYVSLDGIGDKHDNHRRHPGAFVLADRALRRLAALRLQSPDVLRVTAGFTITDRNTDQILPVLDYVTSLDIKVDYIPAARPEAFLGGGGLQRKFQVDRPQVAEVRDSLREVCKHPERINFSSAFYATVVETLETGRRTRGCFYPRKGFVLMPDGAVYICGTYLDFIFGNVLEAGFATLWAGAARAQCLADKIPAKCETCLSNSYEDWDLEFGAVV